MDIENVHQQLKSYNAVILTQVTCHKGHCFDVVDVMVNNPLL